MAAPKSASPEVFRVDRMPGGGIHLRPTHALEQELQSELNQAWVVKLTGYEPKVRVVGGQQSRVIAASGVWRAELDAIKRVEELCPELQAELVIRTEVRGLKEREVPVIDTCPSKRRVHARLVSKGPSGRRQRAARGCKAIRVEPSKSRRRRGLRYALAAARYDVRTQSKVLSKACA